MNDHPRARLLIASLLTTTLGVVSGATIPASAEPTGTVAGVELKIYDGDPADIADLPALVLIELPGASCTGTAVDASWVLSAAHCFEPGIDPQEVVVQLGGDTMADGFTESRPVRRVVAHPDYVSGSTTADIALLELSRPTSVAAQFLAPAAATDPVGADAVIAGWGATTSEPEVIASEVLRRAEVPVLEDEACAEIFGPDYRASASVCAGGQGKDVCEGDSGGPLLIRDDADQLVQYGLVSYGERCGPASSTIGVYTSIGAYRPWIDAVIIGTTPPAGRFTDVPTDSTHAAAISTITDAGIASGFGDQTFRPDDPVTRAQLSTLLGVVLGLDVDDRSDPGYTDVLPGSTHSGAISALTEAGIAGGYADGRFLPGRPVTRAEMASFLARALVLDLATVDVEASPLVDVRPTDTHAPAITAIVEHGIATGFADDTYRPDDEVTRGQMASFLTAAFVLESPPSPTSQPTGQ